MLLILASALKENDPHLLAKNYPVSRQQAVNLTGFRDEFGVRLARGQIEVAVLAEKKANSLQTARLRRD
jgi:hypothetical protein